MLFLLFALGVSALKEGYVNTPHGPRPSECVMQFPKGSIVGETPDGLLSVEFADGSKKLIKPHPKCHESMAELMAKRDEPNAWLDNAGWYPPGKDMSKFTGTYTVPAGNPERGGATLYYFIGMQNNGQGPVNILQPVLAYQGSGWSFTSWICCPSNISTTGNTVRTKAGAVLKGIINRVDGSTWDVVSTNEAGSSSNLKQRVGPYKYTWADVTMEQYGYSSCSQSPKGPIRFSDMKIYNAGGTEIIQQAQWSKTGRTMCSGTLIEKAKDDITIEHSTS